MQPAKWKRNKIFQAVAAGGLDPEQCTFHHDDSGARVDHSPSGSYFLLEGDPTRYISTAVVGDNPSWSSEAFTWATVEERVERWAREVKEDFDTPDLWAELQRQREIITVSRYADAENTPFTGDERAEIAEQLGQIKDLIRETSWDSEHPAFPVIRREARRR